MDEPGKTPPGIEPDNYRLYVVIKYIAYLGVAAHSAFIPLFWSIGVRPLAIFNVFSVASWIVAMFLNRNGRHIAAINLLTIEVVLHAALATYILGWDSGFQTYLMPMIVVTMINYKLRMSFTVAQAAAIVGLYTVLYAFTSAPGYSPVTPGALRFLHYANIAVVFAAICVVSYFFREASIKSERRMEELATTDQLTRVPNRRKIRELLDTERTRFERTQRPFVVILSDIDHFKKFNDTYGHACGDYVLKMFAQTLRTTLREQDWVGRWGGEEFLALLPETSLEKGEQAAERMRRAVEETGLTFGGQTLRVTATFGVAAINPPEPVDQTVKRADLALYEGKERGRNRVAVSRPIAPPEPAAAVS